LSGIRQDRIWERNHSESRRALGGPVIIDFELCDKERGVGGFELSDAALAPDRRWNLDSGHTGNHEADQAPDMFVADLVGVELDESG
jgi:hypothetical protein